MRELPVTIALSLLVHAAALGWYVATDHSQPSRPVARAAPSIEVAPPPAPVEEPPVEIALLDDDTVTQIPDAAPSLVAATRRATARVTRTEPAIVATTQTTTELPPVGEPAPTTEPTKKSALSMRDGKPEPTIHRPGSDGISDEMLEKMINGEIPVKITNLPGARESADFDKANARLHNRNWVENATGDELTAARFDRLAAREAKENVELVEQKDGTYTSDKTTFKAKVNRDGTVTFSDKKNLQIDSPFSARFDVTDAFMRDHGQDPYASEKLRFLDRTREQRYEIGKRYRKEQLGRSAQLMAQNLARLWSITSDPQKRKEELFALWDECAETGDEDLVFGGTQARQLVINWIHTKHVVFTPAELAAFEKRKQSKATFAP